MIQETPTGSQRKVRSIRLSGQDARPVLYQSICESYVKGCCHLDLFCWDHTKFKVQSFFIYRF